jgi:transposase
MGTSVPKKGVHVPKGHRPYPPEFRADAVRLWRSSGRPHQQVADELGVSVETVRAWVKQADVDGGRRNDGLSGEEREELRRLRRENRVLREEREILKKSVAFFARENDSTR